MAVLLAYCLIALGIGMVAGFLVTKTIAIVLSIVASLFLLFLWTRNYQAEGGLFLLYITPWIIITVMGMWLTYWLF